MRIAVNNYKLDIGRQGISWGRIAKAPEGTRGVARDSWQSPYLAGLRNQVPLKADYALYKLLREAIPCLDTAISKLVLLVGKPTVIADEPLKSEINAWLRSVRVNHLQQGFTAWVANHVDSMLWSGKAVGEIIPSNAGDDIYALRNLESDTIVYQQSAADPHTLVVCQQQTARADPVPLDPEWTVVNLRNPGTNPHGVSLFRSLPFVAEILATMEQAFRQTWERFGSPTFRVNWTAPEGYADPTGEKTTAIMAGIESAFVEAMEARKQGKIRDFFTSSVEVSVIGADGHVLDFQEPYLAIMQQIAGVTGLPYWMLGFPWGTTERLSTQQADVLIATIDGIWDELYPDVYRIIERRLALTGARGDFEVVREATTLQDAVETARGKMMEAQAERVRESTSTRLWQCGIYTQEQYAGHVLGEQFDGEIAEPMDQPPAPAPSPFGGFGGGMGQQVQERNLTCSRGHLIGKQAADMVEQPTDARIAAAIAGFHTTARAAVRQLRRSVWRTLSLPGKRAVRVAKAVEPPTPEQDAALDTAIERFLVRMAGADRSKLGFAAADNNGIIQEWDRFSYSLGARRAADMTQTEEPTIGVGANEPGVRAMLERGFDRLSENGQLRLEGIRDELRQIIQDGVDASVNPLDLAREMSALFDDYEGWEFERLARTEVAFAQNDGLMEEFDADGVDTSTVAGDTPPFHPNCLCSISVNKDDAGNWVAIYDIAATACELCQEYVQ